MSASLATLPSHELLVRTHDLIRRGNALEADLLEHLGEVDARRLYLQEACPSMFSFCLRVLHFSESVAYKRIRAARSAREHPEVLAAVRRGELHVTAVSLLAPELTTENARVLVRAARHKTADEIRRLLADLKPKPDVPSLMRRIPEGAVSARGSTTESTELDASSTSAVATSPVQEPTLRDAEASEAGSRPRPAVPRETWMDRTRSEPLGGERYCIRFTADAALHAQIQELRALMRHQIPDGDIGKILASAVPLLLEQVRKRKFAVSSAPRRKTLRREPITRSIPAAVRRAVAKRDEDGCAYVSADGRRCGSREFLEFHHLDPWARTKAHRPEAISLYCRAHNQHEAAREFGEGHMARFRRPTPKTTSDHYESEQALVSEASLQLDPDPPTRA